MSPMTQHRRWNVRVAVRIPRDGGADIRSDTTRRLQQIQCIDSVEVVELDGLQPTLSATVARFELVAVTDTAQPAGGVREQLASASGVESVEQVEPAL